MSNPFVPDDFDAPRELVADGFRLEPLGPEHNERDHEAWMTSIDHIRATPGFPDGNWPSEMTRARNLEDLVRHADDFEQRKGYTFSVLDGDAVIGCVYIYPSKDDRVDADVLSWVRETRAELDEPLYQAVRAWLEADWPFEHIDWNGRV